MNEFACSSCRDGSKVNRLGHNLIFDFFEIVEEARLVLRLDVRSLHHRPSSDHSITQFTRICFSRTNQIKFRIWGSTNFSDLENALRSTSAESGWYDRSEGRREHEITLALEHEALVCIRTDHHPNVSTHFWFHWNLFAGTQMAQQRERDRRTTAANGRQTFQHN